MSLHGNLVGEVSIESSGDVFHELFRDLPHQIADITPQHVQGCDLHEGKYGAAGSIIEWTYFHDGKQKKAKEEIVTVDEEKKSIVLKVLEGDVMELYKSILVGIHVDTNGEDNLVTWTLDYEKLNEDVPDPTTILDFFIELTKAIETHHLQDPKKSLIGNMVCKVSIKSSGDVFHELFRDLPHQIADITPELVQACHLHEGRYGAPGSIIEFTYFHDGKQKKAKHEIVTVDEDKKSIVFKVLKGEVLEEYKSFLIGIHVETKGENNLVTWTIDYEKVNEDVPDPKTIIDYFIELTKAIETHHIQDSKKTSLNGNLVGKVSIKSSGDVFHELFRDLPHEIANITPHHVQGCDLHEGKYGTAGSIIEWTYFHDGKQKKAKEEIVSVDEEKKSIVLKVLEGDVMELYKSILVGIHVDTNGEDNLVTWTLDYEKLNEDVPDPITILDFFIDLTKAIETHHLQN